MYAPIHTVVRQEGEAESDPSGVVLILATAMFAHGRLVDATRNASRRCGYGRCRKGYKVAFTRKGKARGLCRYGLLRALAVLCWLFP